MSAGYPGDAQDALYMNDGPSPHWWMSPDIWLGPTPGGTVAYQGSNTVSVRARMHTNKTFSASQARIDVYVGNPSLVMTPTAGTRLLGQPLVAKTALSDGVEIATLTWTTPPIDAANPNAPDQPGHRCLIARIYPYGTARPSVFNVPNEQHEAQLNISIATTAKDGAGIGGAGAGMGGAGGGAGEEPGPPIGPGADGMWGFLIDTTTAGPEVEKVVIRAEQAVKLSAGEQRPLLLALANHHQFEGFVERDVPFEIDWEVPDEYRPGVEYVAHEGECDVDVDVVDADPFKPDVDQLGHGAWVAMLEPQRIARFAVKVDMSNVDPGLGAVFHVTQQGGGGDVQGGLTVVMLSN